MLTIYIIDLSADARKRVTDLLSSHLRTKVDESFILPQISFKSFSLQELKFHGAPDVCLVGEELLAGDISALARIRKLFPDCCLLAKAPHSSSHLSMVEQLVRLGADDVLEDKSFVEQFIKKLVVIGRKARKKSSGELLLVDSGKGGQGVTSITAAIGEAAFEMGKKVLLIDLDFESQDLSRFLQVRPFLNENLRLLLDQQRPVTEEFVDQCVVQTWEGERGLSCMPPPPETDDVYSPLTAQSRTFAAVLELLDLKYDLMIVDVGAARGALRSMLYRLAERVVIVTNNDPASLYACAERVSRMKGNLSPESRVIVVQNRVEKNGLSSAVFQEEFSRAASCDSIEFFDKQIPYCGLGQRWPGSGASFASQCRPGVASKIDELCRFIGISGERGQLLPTQQTSSLYATVKGWGEMLLRRPATVAALPTGKEQKLLDVPSPQALISTMPSATHSGSSQDLPPFIHSAPEESADSLSHEVKHLVSEPSVLPRGSSKFEVA